MSTHTIETKPDGSGILTSLVKTRLQAIVNKHSAAAQLVAGVIDAEGRRVAGPAECCMMCDKVGEPSRLESPCMRQHLRDAASSKEPVIFTCGNGIHAAIVAIHGSDAILGYVVGAQSVEAPLSDHARTQISSCVGSDCTHREAERLDALAKLPVIRTEEGRLERAKVLQNIAEEVAQICWYEQQLREIEATNAKLAALNTAEAVAAATMDGVMKIFGKINIAIYKVEQDGLLHRVAHRAEPGVAVSEIIEPGDGRVGYVARHRKPEREAGDRQSDVPSLQDGQSNMNLRSDLTVPIFGESADQLVGVLQIASDNEFAIEERHENLLQTLANLAGLHLKRVEDHSAARAAESAALRPVLQSILQIAFEQIGCSTGDVGLLDATGAELEICAAIGPLKNHLPISVSSAAGISGRVMSENRTIVVQNMATDPDVAKLLAQRDENDPYGRSIRAAKSTAKTPIRIDGKVVGILCVHWGGPNQVPPRAEPALELLAERIGAIIEVFRNQERSWTLPFLRQRLNSGVDIQYAKVRLYKALSDEAQRLTGSERANVREFDKERELFRFVADSGPGWNDEIRKRVRRLHEPSGGSEAVRLRRPYVLLDVKPTDAFWHLFDDVRSHISVPIICRERIAGVLSVDSLRANAYGPTHVLRLERLAAQCAEVLEHFALHQDTWLLNLEQLMAATQDLQTLCGNALDHIRNLFGIEACSIYLKYPGKKQLKMASAFPHFAGQDYDVGEGLTGWVAKYKRVLRLRNARDPEERALYDPAPVHTGKSADIDLPPSDPLTFLAAPLVVHDTLVGVLRLSVLEVDGSEFSSEDEVLITRLATSLALFIQNNWLAKGQERAIKQLRDLNDLGGELAGTLSLDAAAQIVLTKGLPILGCDAGHVRVFDRTARNLALIAATGIGKERVKPIRSLGEGISGRVFLRRSPWTIRDFLSDPKGKELERDDFHVSRDELMHWLRSLSCYPLMVQGECIGTLTVHWPDEVTPEALSLLKDIANRAAVAIKAALLFQEKEDQLKRKIEFVSSLGELGLPFGRRPDLNQLQRDILATALRESGADTGVLRTFSDRNRWVLKAALDSDGNSIIHKFKPVIDGATPLLSRVAEDREMVVLPDVQFTPEFRAFRDSLTEPAHIEYLNGLRSMLIVPLCLRDRCEGLLIFGANKPYSPTPSTIEVLGILAGYAAVAIENALYAEREKELRLAKPLAMMGTMLGSFEHVMRGGLQAIAGGLEALSVRPELRPDSERIDRVRQSVVRLAEIVSDVAVFTGTAPAAEHHRLDLSLAAEKAVREIRFGLSGEELRPTIHFELNLGQDCTIRGNRVQLEQAFKLILGNAVEAMPDGGVLTVTTALRSDEVEVSFRDTGMGMDAEALSKCQEPFYTTKEGQGGRGLGLSVVYGIVQRHHGTVDFKSELRQGTTVTLSFERREGR